MKETKQTTEGGADGTYEVGYGRPPKHGQIKKGEVRNPFGRNGRPDRRSTLTSRVDWSDPIDDTFAREAARIIKVQENGRTKKYTAGQLAIRQQFAAAMKGDVAAQREIGRELGARERAESREKQEYFKEVLELKIDLTMQLIWAEHCGDPVPELPLHPENIFFAADGEIHLLREAAAQEAERDEPLHDLYLRRQETIDELEQSLKDLKEMPEYRKHTLKYIELAKKRLAIFDPYLPKPIEPMPGIEEFVRKTALNRLHLVDN